MKKRNIVEVQFNGDIIRTVYSGRNKEVKTLTSPIIQFSYYGELTEQKIQNAFKEYVLSLDLTGNPSGPYIAIQFLQKSTK